MNCPDPNAWDLLAMGACDGGPSEDLLTHLHACPACRELHRAACVAHERRIAAYAGLRRDHDDLREQLMAAVRDEAPPRREGALRAWPRRLGEFVMQATHTPIRRATAVLLPAAAAIAIVFMVFAADSKSAFAAAIEKLRSSRTIVCSYRAEPTMSIGPLQVVTSGKMYMSETHGTRLDIFAGELLVATQFMPPQGPAIQLSPLTKTYTRMDFSRVQPSTGAAGSTPDAWLQCLRSLTESPDRELGHSEIEGRDAIGFEVSGSKMGYGRPLTADDSKLELWVDAQTRLPVQLVVDLNCGADIGAMRLIYEDFRWDEPIEPAHFQPVIPEDYKLIDVTMPEPSEEMLISMLGYFAETSGRGYPRSLSGPAVIGELVATSIAKGGDQDQQEVMAEAMKLGAGIAFYGNLGLDGAEPEYFGDEVKPGDAKAVLIRWKLKDGGTRVIYGDLRAETLP